MIDTTGTGGSIKSGDGSISIGEARDGSQITVNNIQLDAALIQQLVQQLIEKKEPSEATTERDAGAYLDYIQSYYRLLKLKGMGNNSGLRLVFPLIELFVPLNARLSIPEADRLPDDLRVAGRKLQDEELRELPGGMERPQPVLWLVQDHPVLVILGDPGSGKSTVLTLLALLLATGQGQELGLEGYLPLLLPLSAYSDQLQKSPRRSLYDFSVEYFKQRLDAVDMGPFFIDMLKRGRVLILLDGLDEVKSQEQRNIVVERVQHFICQHAKKGNRVVMSCRIIGYHEVRPPEVEGLRECTLLDFDDAEIADFIRRWTAIIERHSFENESVAKYEARRETEELLTALEQKPEIRRLAANPLLLTMLVILKRQGKKLPRHRVLLYEQYLTSLLDEWLHARSLDGAVAQDLPDERKLRKVLEPLAYWMQTASPGKGMVPERDLVDWLKKWFSLRKNPEQEAGSFLRDVREHSGLLLNRGGRMYGFMHLTFMEYLAAVHIAKNRAITITQFSESAGHADWRETLLLATSCLGLRDGRDEELTELLGQLLDVKEKDPGAIVELVAAALADMGEEGVTEEGWIGLRARLVMEGLRNTLLPAQKRVAVGNHLAELGDPRAGVTALEDMQFCHVPAGSFFLGTENDNADDDEKEGAGPHEMNRAYWLGRYPVTVAQYRQYLQESEVKPEDEDCQKGPANTPVVWVSQKEAESFCDWLTTRWCRLGLLPEGYRAALPSEPEWEKAAKGGYKIPAEGQQRIGSIGELSAGAGEGPALIDNNSPHRDYPWEGGADPERMNFAMNIGSRSAVGAYPGGASPYGCEEMSGNVWEWTRSPFEAYPYPTKSAAVNAHEKSGGNVPRVLRGGAFFNLQWSARCSYRLNFDPDSRSYFIGFRVVLSPLR